MDSRVTVTVKGRDTSYDSLMEDLEAAGVQVYRRDLEGELHGGARPNASLKEGEVGTADERVLSVVASEEWRDTQLLSDALRKRLAAKGTDNKNT